MPLRGVPAMNSEIFITNYVLVKLVDEPVYLRIQLYLALADTCGDESEAKKFKELAAELSQSELRYREFAFNFAAKNSQLKLNL